jgi:MFS family permease
MDVVGNGLSQVVTQTDDSRRVAVLLGLLFGFAGMGSSSAAVAVPLVADDLGVSTGLATWTISLYVLFLAITTAVYGRVSDLVGTRLPLLIGVALMTTGALVAALAPSFEVLLAARLVQGAGAAAIPTMGITLINHRYAGQVRGLALGRLAAMAAALSCLGPLLGGLVEHVWGWRAVMALPLLGLVLVPFVLPSLTRHRTGARLDVVGALLVAVTSGGVVLLLQAPATGLAVALVGAGLLLLGAPATVRWLRRRPDGFLPVAVVRNGAVVRSALAAASVPASWFALLVGVPALLLDEGREPWQVGLLLAPSAAVALVVPRLTSSLVGRVGPTVSLVGSALAATVALGVAALGAALVSTVVLGVAVVLVTVAFGVGQPSMGAAVADAVPAEVRGVALGVGTLVFLVGGSLGSAVVGGLGPVMGIAGSLAVLAAFPVAAALLLGRDLLVREVAPVPDADPVG